MAKTKITPAKTSAEGKTAVKKPKGKTAIKKPKGKTAVKMPKGKAKVVPEVVVKSKNTRKCRKAADARRKATAAPPPGTYADQSDADDAPQPGVFQKKTRKVRAARHQDKGMRKSLAAPPPGAFYDDVSESELPGPSAKSSKCSDSEDSDDDEDDHKNVKLSRNMEDHSKYPAVKTFHNKILHLEKPRPRPKFTIKSGERMHFRGLNDFQINQYLAKTGFKDIGVGYAAMKGNVVVVKSGYIRLLVTPDHKHYAIPNSMTADDWNLIKFCQTEMNKKVLVFVTREYVRRKFIKQRGRNASIPSDQEIIDKYCRVKVKVSKDEYYYEYKEAHSAILLIDGTKFRLFDANNFHKIQHEDPRNFFVKEFWNIFKSRLYPHIYRAWGLKAEDTRDFDIVKCHYSDGVTNSCALYLLFVAEQMADNRWNLDVNWTPALTQLFASKVNTYVGGLTGFNTFKRLYPDWLTRTPPFLFTPLLSQLKGGDSCSISELAEEKERIASLFYMEFEK